MASNLYVKVGEERVAMSDLVENWVALHEAATIKAKALGVLRMLTAFLEDRTVPAALRKEVEDVRVALRRTWSDLESEAGAAQAPPAEEEPEEPEEPEEAERGGKVYKTVDGEMIPAASFLVVEDPEQPTTWHLQVRDADGNIDHRLMGAAKAALTSPSGFRGNKYEGPDKAKAIAALKRLYEDEEMVWAGESDEGLAEAELMEADLEVDEGSVLDVVEAQPTVPAEKGGVVYVDFRLLKPGWGNTKTNYYYPPDVVRRDAPIFKGAKMYLTEHVPGEKNVRNEVAQIMECPLRFDEDGAPVARAAIFDAGFEHNVLRRKQAGALSGLQVSIHARGKAAGDPYQADGRAGKRVAQIQEAISVDFVAKAGAGGHAVDAFTESQSTSEGAKDMGKEEQEKGEPNAAATVTEKAEFKEQEPTVPFTMATALAALIESGLPAPAQKHLAGGMYANMAEFQQAIEGMKGLVQEIKEAEPVARKTGSAALAMSSNTSETGVTVKENKPMATEKEVEILKRHGMLG